MTERFMLVFVKHDHEIRTFLRYFQMKTLVNDTVYTLSAKITVEYSSFRRG